MSWYLETCFSTRPAKNLSIVQKLGLNICSLAPEILRIHSERQISAIVHDVSTSFAIQDLLRDYKRPRQGWYIMERPSTP